jgi:hypothetical protein
VSRGSRPQFAPRVHKTPGWATDKQKLALDLARAAAEEARAAGHAAWAAGDKAGARRHHARERELAELTRMITGERPPRPGDLAAIEIMMQQQPRPGEHPPRRSS